MSEIDVLKAKNEKLHEMLSDYRRRHFMVVDAHQALILRLYALATDEGMSDGPEACDCEIQRYIREFFTSIEYHDVTQFLDQINTNY